MMSSETLADESESPEIVIVSCSLSSSSMSPTSPPRESMTSPPKQSMTSLLRQIQQCHTTKIQKQQEHINRLKMKCIHLANLSNDHGAIARQYSEQNKILKSQVMELKRQLRLLQSTRQDGSVSTSKIQASNADQALPNHETPQAHSSPNRDCPKKLFRVPSKLASKKFNKKVRYSDISSTENFQKPAETLQLRNSNKELRHDAVASTKRTTVYAKTLANFQAPQNITQAVASPDGVILAPDTCVSPSVQASFKKRNQDSGGFLGEHATFKQTLDGPGKGIMNKRSHTVPETLAVEAEDGASFEMDDESLIDAPTYASTPVASHSQMLSEPVTILFKISSQSPDSTRLNLLSSKMSSKQALNISPLTVSIPRSESQFPVDLSSTQAKSPTFCGDGLATPGSSNGKSWLHDSTAVDRNVPSPHGGDRSGITDESYESEASILLLNPHVPKRVTIRVSPETLPRLALNDKKAAVSRETNDKQFKGKPLYNIAETSKGSCSTRILADTPAIKEEGQQGTDIPPKPRANLSRMSTCKKRKLDTDESTMYDDTVLPEVRSLGKENGLEGLEGVNQTSGPTSTRSKIQTKGCKNLKQSKLILNKIQPGKNKHASLMREYNGGSLVSVDSQSDAFMNRAKELSLMDHEQEKVRGKDGLESGNIEDEFKVPNLPHKKQQQRSVTPDAGVDKKASQHRRIVFNQEDLDLPEKFDFMHSPHDLNGSVDPLMNLTRLETESSQLTTQANQSVTGRTPLKKQVGRRQEHEEEMVLSEMADDSCQDLFEDDEDGESEGGGESEGDLETSAVGGETSFVRNFDIVPKVVDKPNYKYAEVVRKHEDRQKLKGFGCKECEAFYGDLSLTESQREKRMKMCSRHRGQFSPPNTPDHYWSVGFPDTQTCLQRGYIKESSSPNRRARLRKKQKYKKLFSGKEVDDARQDMEDGN